ncbi:hypothetical protein LSH36_752g01024 [Paralvinella palmiformis]|uniref:COR domain-containing protein n=1 Tax=Paralvinella palmiformis TaxID=53620 RepID=A0AAD9J1U7_9ANNE|nr:hypothetical protein LSH36_752g01024 [Paralvinella palmiformis]
MRILVTEMPSRDTWLRHWSAQEQMDRKRYVELVINGNCVSGDSTLTKRRSFGDQYMLFVHQNTRDYMENNFPPGRETIRDMVLIQDECLPPLRDMLHRIDYSQLATLYVVDCRLQVTDTDDDVFKDLTLTSLVLSRTHLRRLPRSIFEMESLEVLKVDGNCLDELPSDIGNLSGLRSFCCDGQRPPLTSMPPSITKLGKLEVLSFSDNRIENISWVVALPNLRVLRCARNRITRLPNQLANLRELAVLDVSHNRLRHVAPSFTELIHRLYRFEYFNLTLRPKHIMRDRSLLVAHLDLANFLGQAPIRRTARDVSVAVVGESHAGKSTLVEALKAERGVCKQEFRSRQESTFEIHQFEMHGSEQSCYVSTIVLANDILDNFSRSISVDLYLLVVDLTSLEIQNGSQHLFARHVSRLQMWLQALYEIAPDTPVLIVGTHAEMVKSMSFADIWHVLEGVLDQGRTHHVKRFAESRLQNCLLCNPKHLAVRHVLAKSRSGSAGFVDLSYPHAEPMMNGHVSSGESPPPSRARYSHVVGYYEIDSKKHFPKDAKKSNVSIEQLKAAIMRLTHSGADDGIPPSWLSFIRHMATINEQAPDLPCIPFEEVVSISRSMEIPPAQVPYMLKYFHQRGKLVYFSNDDVLGKLVVISPTWFIQRLSRMLDGFKASKVAHGQLLDSLQDKDLDRQLQKAGIVTTSSAHWLLAALQRLELCVSFAEYRGEKQFLMPSLLEKGYPSHDVWPDLPEWDEKQVTCDFSIRALKPCLFTDLVLRLNREGRELLEIVSDPAPVFLSHHIVFYTAVDVGGCDDCHEIRRSTRAQKKSASGGGVVSGVVGGSGDESVQDDILHKVHIQLHPKMSYIRIAIRGVSPCCTMKAVVQFLDLFLDDIPEEEGEGSLDRTSLGSSHLFTNTSAASVTFSSDRGSVTSRGSDDEEERQFFLLCPKCVLLRHANPERIAYQSISPKRKAICSRWHNLGSWTRAVTGDYRYNCDTMVANSLTVLPEYEHPRLVMILPPSGPVSIREWYMSSRMKFLEGFEVHVLCEYTGFWHLVEDGGYKLCQSKKFVERVGNQLPTLLNMALPMVQIINGVHEHGLNGRLLAPVIGDLIKQYDYLRNVDTHIQDPYTWLAKNKERVVTMLTKVMANASDGFPDLYFKIGNAIQADSVFQLPSRANRFELAKFLRIDASSGRFGPLRPLYVGQEIRWLCDAHYEELRGTPSK